MDNNEQKSYHVAYYNQNNENYRKRLESVRTLFAFWFTTLGGIAYIAFDQLKTANYLETSIILIIGAFIAFIIGNMIKKNQYHISLLNSYIKHSELYKYCDVPEAHLEYKGFHLRESTVDNLLSLIIPIAISLFGIYFFILWLV